MTTRTAKQALIRTQMASVVPDSAIVYVDDLGHISTPQIVEDRLAQLHQYCPNLVFQYCDTLLTEDEIWALADDHERGRYEDEGEAAFGRED